MNLIVSLCSFEDSAFYEESKQEYLQERDQFETSGKPVQKPKRTS
jgi:hypothetical protein